MLALDNELVFLAHVPRTEELLAVLAVKQRRLVTIQSSLTCRFCEKGGKSEASFQRKGSVHAVVGFTGRTSDEVWEVETDLTRVALTRAAHEGKPVRVLEAEVEGQFALGRRDHVRVCQAHLQLQVVFCFVAKTIPGMLTPCPLGWVFYRLLWIL